MYIKQSKRTKKNQKKRATLGAQEEKKIYKKKRSLTIENGKIRVEYTHRLLNSRFQYCVVSEFQSLPGMILCSFLANISMHSTNDGLEVKRGRIRSRKGR